MPVVLVLDIILRLGREDFRDSWLYEYSSGVAQPLNARTATLAPSDATLATVFMATEFFMKVFIDVILAKYMPL